MKYDRIIAVDFDGCLATNEFPNIGSEITETIRRVKEEQRKGSKIILWTCRKDDELTAAVEYCRDNGLEFDYINENAAESIKMFGKDTRKIYATAYLDDRNITLKEVEG